MRITADEAQFRRLYEAVASVVDSDGRGFLHNQSVIWETTKLAYSERCKRIFLYVNRLWALVFKSIAGETFCNIIASEQEPKFVDIFLNPDLVKEKEIQLLEFYPDLHDPDKPQTAEIDL